MNIFELQGLETSAAETTLPGSTVSNAC